ncbi:MAG: aminotransferase class III-fold pyridoxal phosphate-dependent enzyme [Streptomyces sp.]|nr:aminotransferase class III-fold pyridoxal phosphate-dependent enzyme [Streptomyces sp.]
MRNTLTAQAEERDLAQLDRLIVAHEKLLTDRMRCSLELREAARATLAGGVASAWQDSQPGAIWIERGEGGRVWDADGTEYVDMHGGFGAGLAGHAHPAVVEAVERRVRMGTHFGHPTEDLISVSRLLRDRFRLPLWRFSNSGTEATMDAVHLMRVATGRKKIIKVEGAYHGHHDSVQVSTFPTPEGTDIGPDHRPRSVPHGPAIPGEFVDLTVAVPFGDIDAARTVLEENPDSVAGMIIEPVMLNIGVVVPPASYLAELVDLLHAHGAYLAYDEVKTGLAVAPGGATELFGVTPDIVCLAKALGGGLPCGAIGGTAELMELIADNTYQQVGTFNGNPLTMAVARAMLTEVLTPEAYSHLEALRVAIVTGVEELMARYGIPGHVASVGAKGSVIFADRLRDYRDFLRSPAPWRRAHWLYQVGGGILLPSWGKSEQFTLSVQHTTEDARLYVANFERLCRDVRPAQRPEVAS